MQNAFGGKVGTTRGVEIVEATEINLMLGDIDSDAPFAGALNPSDARVAACVVDALFCVVLVLGVGRLAQVGDPVVGGIAVDMADLVLGPVPVRQRPDDPMSL